MPQRAIVGNPADWEFAYFWGSPELAAKYEKPIREPVSCFSCFRDHWKAPREKPLPGWTNRCRKFQRPHLLERNARWRNAPHTPGGRLIDRLQEQKPHPLVGSSITQFTLEGVALP